MERLTYWNCKEKNSALPVQINDMGDTVSLENVCAKLAVYEDAEEQGLLVVLPIPVGGDRCVCGIYEDNGIPAHIVTIECDRLDGLEIWPTGEIVVNMDGWEIGKSDIGKTVFFTLQEAEKALEGMK